MIHEINRNTNKTIVKKIQLKIKHLIKHMPVRDLPQAGTLHWTSPKHPDFCCTDTSFNIFGYTKRCNTKKQNAEQKP